MLFTYYYVVIGVAVFLLTCYVTRRMRRNSRFPPGPFAWPFVGNMLQLDLDQPFVSLYEWYKSYGSIFGARFASVPVLVLCDAAIIKLAFNQEEFSGKAPLYVTNGIMDGYGIISAEGKRWKEQRKFTVGCLRDFGFSRSKLSRSRLEALITEEVHYLIQKFSEVGDEAFDANGIVRTAVANLICSILFGKRYEDDDPEFVKLRRQLDNCESGSLAVKVSGIMNFFPLLRFLPYYKKFLTTLLQGKTDHHKFLTEIVDQHRDSLSADASTDVTDFVEAYLVEMNKQNEVPNDKHFSQKQLLHLMADLFGAGVETMKLTLRWTFLHLMLRPDVQRKVQEELDTVVGRERNPCLDDISRLPYTEATVMEAQRISSVVPIGSPHGTTKDTVFLGYHIPKGTMVISLLYAVHKDPAHWPQPEVFKPERFINENGKVFKPDNFMPFSVGRRQCLGEELAKMSLFLLVANIVHRFEIQPSSEGFEPDLRPLPGFIVSPRPYTMRAIHRP